MKNTFMMVVLARALAAPAAAQTGSRRTEGAQPSSRMQAKSEQAGSAVSAADKAFVQGSGNRRNGRGRPRHARQGKSFQRWT